jgi:hypothetical protein
MVTFKAGHVSGPSLNPGTVPAGLVTLSVDLVLGKWSATNGTSGTLSAANLTALIASLTALRNTAESFAAANGVVPGAAVAWANLTSL